MIKCDLYCCADGILRVKWSEKKPLIPLLFIQEQLWYQSDLPFIFQWWNNNVYFEAGLTLGKFLECLKPWQYFLSNFLNKEVELYIKEAEEDTEQSQLPLIEWIVLMYCLKTTPELENDCHNKDYQIKGYKKGEMDSYSLDYKPLNKLINIPIFLNDKENKTLESEGIHTLQNVIIGFFESLLIEPLIKLYKNEEVINKTNKNLHVVNNEKINNIIDIRKYKKNKIGEFNSCESEDLFWNTLLNEAKIWNVVLRIGKLEIAKMPNENEGVF